MERSYLLLLFALVPVFTSCNSSQETAKPRVPDAKTNPSGSNEIVLVVARYMFDKFAPQDGGVSEAGFHCFIVNKPNDTPELLAEFADFRIPVLGSERLKLKNGSPYDMDTNNQAMVWEAFDVKSIGERDATVNVEWMLGPDGAAGYTVQLVRRDGKWIVESVEEQWMS